MTRKLPPTASVAEPQAGGKLYAPAAARNADALCAVLTQHGPASGTALEIASGTGQHIVTFASALPGLNWQPSEIDPARRISIDAHVAEAGLTNVAPAMPLDACAPGWAATRAPFDLIVLVNLLHLISDPEAKVLISEASRALAPGGTFVFYGPFKRAGALTSEGDARFDAELRSADPLIGYKDDLDIADWMGKAGLDLTDPLELPANNLAFVARKPV
jgi:SAM-dependent methyltransferase